MTSINLTAALAFIDQDEGPELNIGGSEPGGSSKHGISMTVLQEWHKAHGLPPPTLDDMRAVDATLAGQIYTVRFAEPIRFDELPSGVDYRLLDIAVNLGVTGASVALQLALRIWPLTSVIDDTTIYLAQNVDAKALILTLSGVWIAKKYENPNWHPSPITKSGYGHGWVNRNMRATDRATALITKGTRSEEAG